MRIIRFLFADSMELTPELQLIPVNEVPASIQLLNPSPGTIETMLEWAVGIEVTGLQPGASVSAVIELCHEDVGKWIKIWGHDDTVGPEADRWLAISQVKFPPAREGTWKFRLTVKSNDISKREVRKVAIRYRATKVGSA